MCGVYAHVYAHVYVGTCVEKSEEDIRIFLETGSLTDLGTRLVTSKPQPLSCVCPTPPLGSQGFQLYAVIVIVFIVTLTCRFLLTSPLCCSLISCCFGFLFVFFFKIYAQQHLGFYVGSRDLNSNPQACTTVFLSTELSPKPRISAGMRTIRLRERKSRNHCSASDGPVSLGEEGGDTRDICLLAFMTLPGISSWEKAEKTLSSLGSH